MESLEKSYVAGPWHPAFCELCESGIYLEKARTAVQKCCGGTAILYVNPHEISKLTGQHRSNILVLETETGAHIKICGDPKLHPYEVRCRRITIAMKTIKFYGLACICIVADSCHGEYILYLIFGKDVWKCF